MVAVSPADGATIADTDAITIDVTSALAGFRVIITAEFPSIAETEVVFDGTTFTSRYRNAITSASPITDGTRFVFLRSVAWPDVRVRVTVDVFGADGSFVQSIYQWVVIKAEAAASTPPSVVAKPENDPLGFGPIRPFRVTSSGELACGSGEDLIESNVGEILGVRQGEVWWWQSLGASPESLRHRLRSAALAEVGRIQIAGQFARWEPRAQVRQAEAVESQTPEGTDLQLRVRYSIEGGKSNVADIPL